MGYRGYSTAIGKIVDPNGLGDFTTLGAALAAASSNETIFLRPGTYTENDTISTAVNIAAFPGDGYEGNVIIKGNMTISAAIEVTFSGVELQTNSAAFLTVSGSAATTVNLFGCYLNCTNATGISYSSSSSSSSIICYNCQGNLATTGIGLFSSSGAGSLSFNYCNFSNTGASTTASTSSVGPLSFLYCTLTFAISTSSTATIASTGNTYSLGSINTTAITHGGAGSTSRMDNITTGTASGISISGGSTLTVTNALINNTNTNAITGAGTLRYSNLAFSLSGALINTTTQIGGVAYGGLSQAPSAGFIGEQIRSAANSSISNNSLTNLTSISLTAGVWDISAVGNFINTGVSTFQQLGISTTSVTITGTQGDQWVQENQVGAAAPNVAMSLPSFRVVVTSTTPYYLVVLSDFSTGSSTCYGRISATRVG